MTHGLGACLLCGHDDRRDIRMGLVEWLNSDKPYGAVPRCRDVTACKQRVDDMGEPWPIRDAYEVVR